jgi:ribosomal protein S27E
MKKRCTKCGNTISMWRVFENQVTCSNCGTTFAIKNGKAIEIVAILAAGVIAISEIGEDADLFESLGIALLIGAIVYAIAWMALDLEVVAKGDDKSEPDK